MEYLTQTGADVEKCLDPSKCAGVRVISRDRNVIGKVASVNVNRATLRVDGLTVKRPGYREPLFVGKDYVERIGHDAILLNIEPSYLMEGKKVLTEDGKTVGKVLGVQQIGMSNEVSSIVVKRRFKKPFNIATDKIKSNRTSVIIRGEYEEDS